MTEDIDQKKEEAAILRVTLEDWNLLLRLTNSYLARPENYRTLECKKEAEDFEKRILNLSFGRD